MEEFHSTYAVFFNELKDFIDHLLTSYREESAPDFLPDVKLVLSVLPEDDPDFDAVNEKSICMKTGVVLEVTRIILKKVDPFIRQAVKQDFKKESRKLSWRMDSVMMGMASLQLEEECSQVSYMSGGFSSMNTGVRQAIRPDILVKLHDVYTALQRC